MAKPLIDLPEPSLSISNIKDYNPLEFILIAGYGGSGKSHTILSIAEAWERLHPTGVFYAIDCETGLAKEYKKAFNKLKNFKLWHGEFTEDIAKFLDLFRAIHSRATAEDFIAIESDTKIWDMAQDDAWQIVSGKSKDEYLSERLDADGKKPPVTPQPDNLWQVAGDRYRRQFRDVLVSNVRLRTNIVITTGITKSPKPSAARRVSAAQLDMGDLQLDGHAENSRNPDTVVILSKVNNQYRAVVKKDRAGDKPGEVKEFDINEGFWWDFTANCRQEDE